MCVLVAFAFFWLGDADRLLLGKLDIEDPGHDDFELWTPSEERADRCLFGRQVNKPHYVPHIAKLDCLHLFRRLCIIVVGATVTVSWDNSLKQRITLSRTACAQPLTLSGLLSSNLILGDMDAHD